MVGWSHKKVGGWTQAHGELDWDGWAESGSLGGWSYKKLKGGQVESGSLGGWSHKKLKGGWSQAQLMGKSLWLVLAERSSLYRDCPQ